MATPTDATAILALRSLVEHAVPPYPVIFDALLIPSASSGSRLVPVPARFGFIPTEDVARIDDLEINAWIDPGMSQSASSLDLAVLSQVVKRFPIDNPVLLSNAFTVVVAPQHYNSAVHYVDRHPPNKNVERKVPGLSKPWMGNVLVFKMSGRGTSGQGVVNMNESDRALARSIAYHRPTVLRSLYLPILIYPPPTTLCMSAGDTVSRTPYMAMAILSTLPLKEFIALSQVTRTFRRFARLEFQRRIASLIGPFLTGSAGTVAHWAAAHRAMFALIEDTSAAVVGSIVLALLTFALADAVPTVSNLNLLVPHDRLLQWRIFLQQTFQFKYVTEASVAECYIATCVSVHVFRKDVGTDRYHYIDEATMFFKGVVGCEIHMPDEHLDCLLHHLLFPPANPASAESSRMARYGSRSSIALVVFGRPGEAVR
ncbi:hypothetical protein C8R43DRAFT_1133602 [Mycena crocata]|nr:hypothetical protein C8R43DRAFT_1133602 [Mycena crocata]